MQLDADHDRLDELVDEFLTRIHKGENPSIEEYCESAPELAEEIRELFPTLLLIESQKSGASAEKKQEPALPPDTIGEYTIVRELGRGGMGIVYQAKHRSLGRLVALKIVSQSGFGDQRARKRFQREGRTIAKLHHSNIVPLYEVGEDDGCCYLAMQLINGTSLDRVIRKLGGQPQIAEAFTDAGFSTTVDVYEGERIADLTLPTEELEFSPTTTTEIANLNRKDSKQFQRWVGETGRQVADALAYAHQRGVIHRDIKPSNLLLDDSNVVWVTDFGLAKSEEDEISHSTDLLGTLRYMSPERFEGQCDERTDIYALGLTLRELLTLTPVFEASNRLDLVRLILNEEPVRPRAVDPSISRDLETILLKATDKHPDRRYQTIGEMSEDLSRFLADTPIMARRVSAAERLVRWARRNKKVAALLLFIMTMLSAVAIGSGIAAKSFQRLAVDRSLFALRANRLAEEMSEQRDIAVEAREESRQNLYFAEMIMASDAAGRPGGMRRVRELLDHWVPRDGEFDRRGPEWFYLNSRGQEEVCTFEGHDKPVSAIAIHPTQDLVASGDASGTIRIWNALNADEQGNFPAHDGRLTHLAWNAEGSLLASCGDDSKVCLWNAETLELHQEITAHSDAASIVSWSPDQRYFCSAGKDGIRIFDGETFAPLETIVPSETAPTSNARDHITCVAWHPDSRRLATISQDSTLNIWDVESGQQDANSAWIDEIETLGIWFGNRFVLWSPDGDRLLAGSEDIIDIRIPQEENEKPVANRVKVVGGLVFSAAWIGEQNNLLTAGEDLEVTIRESETLTKEGSLIGHLGLIDCLDVAPNRNLIASASADGTAKIWNLEAVGPGPYFARGGFAVSPDGTKLATTGGDTNKVQAIELDTGVTLMDSETREGWTGYVSWDAASARIATAFGNGRLDSLVDIWDANSGELKGTFNPRAAFVQAIAWHPVEKDRVVVAPNDATELQVWDAAKLELVDTIDVVSWSWDAVKFSTDGENLAVAAHNAYIVDWESRKIVTILKCPENQGIQSVAFSKDGKQFASCGNAGNLYLYRTSDWSLEKTFRGHTGVALDVVFSPDGSRLASSSRDGTLKLWDVESGRLAMSIDLDETQARSIAWTDDGSTIVLGIKGRMQFLDLGQKQSKEQ